MLVLVRLSEIQLIVLLWFVIVKFSDWQLVLVMGGLSHCLLSGVGVDGHMGLGEEFELGEVNAHGATNKQ